MAQPQTPKADIILKADGNRLSISDAISVYSPGLYQVQLQVRKSGKSGSATTRQSKKIEATVDQVYHNSNLNFHLQPGDHIEAELSLYANGSLLVKTIREYSFDNKPSSDNKHL
ncbi:hypothetical protein [uncultured Cohaesibacter sp.]|uniref:hypothetical protein n=1 Tax=uncultured Cohaesibacter sp. TaxID=1002546 RepID=UPI0029C9130B|nr:hypothetical protein [uncultured Cohaesibacter sp.]